MTPKKHVQALIREIKAELDAAIKPYRKTPASLTPTEKQRAMRISKAGRGLERLEKYLLSVPLGE